VCVWFFCNLGGTLLLSYFGARNAAEEFSGLKAATGINNNPLCQYPGMQIYLIKLSGSKNYISRVIFSKVLY